MMYDDINLIQNYKYVFVWLFIEKTTSHQFIQTIIMHKIIINLYFSNNKTTWSSTNIEPILTNIFFLSSRRQSRMVVLLSQARAVGKPQRLQDQWHGTTLNYCSLSIINVMLMLLILVQIIFMSQFVIKYNDTSANDPNFKKLNKFIYIYLFIH